MILGVRRIDGHQWKVAPIFPPLGGGGPGLFSLGKDSLGEDVRNGVGVDRHQGDGLLAGKRAEAFLYPGGR